MHLAPALGRIAVVRDVPMTDFYHMSANPLAAGAEIHGNGKDKDDPRIEAELEKRRPNDKLSRRDAV
jgi:hypothetical protein